MIQLGTVHLSNHKQKEMLTTVCFKKTQRMPCGKEMYDFVILKEIYV